LKHLNTARRLAAHAARAIAQAAVTAAGFIAAARSAQLFVIQLAGAFSVLYGISYWSVPIALIVGGVAAIAAVELQSREPKQDTNEILATQLKIKTALASGQDPFIVPGVPFTPTWVAYAASLRLQR
jgi:hypothetical protein